MVNGPVDHTIMTWILRLTMAGGAIELRHHHSLSSTVCHHGRRDTGGSGQEWSCDTAATEKPLVRAHNRVEVTAN